MKDAVKACILTGIAACLINSSTTHITFKLPVETNDRITGMSPFTGDYHRILRHQCRDMQSI